MAAKYVPFFESFYLASKHLDDERRLAIYDALTSYGFTGEFPDFGGDELLATFFELARPNIDAAIKRSERNRENVGKRWDKDVKQ